jgi:hypothetical protein
MTLSVALLFLFVLLTINFFHTEKSITPCDTCPACQFQHSSLSVGPALPVQLPPLFLIAIIHCPDSLQRTPILWRSLASRSPPLS